MSAAGTPPTGPPAPAKPPAHCAWDALTALSASITASSGSRIVSASANSHSLRTAVHVSSPSTSQRPYRRVRVSRNAPVSARSCSET